jgi:hypothetical protein
MACCYHGSRRGVSPPPFLVSQAWSPGSFDRIRTGFRQHSAVRAALSTTCAPWCGSSWPRVMSRRARLVSEVWPRARAITPEVVGDSVGPPLGPAFLPKAGRTSKDRARRSSPSGGRARRSLHLRGRAGRSPRPRGWVRWSLRPRDRTILKSPWLGRIRPQLCS